MMNSAEIRQAFLDYFSNLRHQVVPSSSLLPANDPTLLFTNAGMVQFKDVFLGTEQRSYQRAVSVQRCLRAGGKHNDLENVGFTTRHHTFFEMLGNFSFGDYFKPVAIRMAWDFLTQILKLPQDRLWVTVYKDDQESATIWLTEIGIAADRLVFCDAEDNFWAMGDTGPCGPCTEIYYDHGPDVAGGPPGSPDMDGDRYVEIWNVVFMQYNRDPEGNLHPLPKPSVDTGMGLERIAAVMQGVHSNYDTDIFLHLRQAITDLAVGVSRDSPSVLVVADHIRSCSFLLADGVLPSNEGRGYVLRRIIRRAVRHGHQLGLPSPFMYRLVPELIAVMGQAYPELRQAQSQIQDVLRKEEEQFIRTIAQGLKLLQESFAHCQEKILPGQVVFKLYDTYGFPMDLTADAAREAGYQIDVVGFEALMQQQRQQSQEHTQFQAEYLPLPENAVATIFQGYDVLESQTSVVALYAEHQTVHVLSQGCQGIVILAETPFYAESGGQMGDQGLLIGPHGDFVVTDTQKKGELVLHLGFVEQGEFQLGEKIRAEVNTNLRQALRLNHSATHLLHAALRELLGPEVQQKGSLVNGERSRFDFSFNRALTLAECDQVEQWVNAKIRQNVPIQTEILALEQAQARGVMALFGEKYGEQVRVLSMGNFSAELCGGTHASRTGDIGLFKMMSESSIAAGVRRIEFATGYYAVDVVQKQLQTLSSLAAQLKTSPAQLEERFKQTLLQMQRLQQENQRLEQRQLLHTVKAAIAAHQAKQQPFLILDCGVVDAKSLRYMSDVCRDIQADWAYVLYGTQDDQLQVIVIVPKILQERLGSAADWVKSLCTKGGGRTDFAQGGTKTSNEIKQKIQKLEQNFIEKIRGG